jgi:hypothetical protein
MSDRISIPALLDRLSKYLGGEDTYDSFRSYVYSRYESDGEITVDEDADDLLSVISPYVETETAINDPNREKRLRRVFALLSEQIRLPVVPTAVFALNYDEIAELTQKLEKNLISNKVYRKQIDRLSPADFDAEVVGRWATEHAGETEPKLEKMR